MSFWLKVVLAAAAAAALWFAFDAFCSHQQEIGELRERGVWEKKEQQRTEAEAKNRARLDAQREESDRETRRLEERAQAERAAADRAAAGLRQQLAVYVAAAKRADPAAVGVGAPAGDPIGVLADVLGRADARAGVLAEYADRARIAGQQCERDYDALKLRQ